MRMDAHATLAFYSTNTKVFSDNFASAELLCLFPKRLMKSLVQMKLNLV